MPILRRFDAVKAREFYVDFLGFAVTFEHGFEPDTPLYMEVRLGDCILHLSEHHGDASPGATLRIETEDVRGFAFALNAKRYANARPGVQRQAWGFDEMTVQDPFGNRLIFCSPIPDGAGQT
ncbi:MAG: glyoxalase superfamily protein [Paracoccaceae bacterium]